MQKGAHLLDVAHSQLHEGVQSSIQSCLPIGRPIGIRQVPPHSGKPVEGCGDVDRVEVLAGRLNNVQNLDNRVGVHNAPVDVSVKVRDC